MATFYICPHCGNIIEKIKDSKVPVVCCGEAMKELKANSIEASLEKHIPTISTKDNLLTVTVGSTLHPMVDNHYIEWIYVETDKGIMRKHLRPNEEPSALFLLNDSEKLLRIYAYCNLHGLWVYNA